MAGVVAGPDEGVYPVAQGGQALSGGVDGVFESDCERRWGSCTRCVV